MRRTRPGPMKFWGMLPSSLMALALALLQGCGESPSADPADPSPGQAVAEDPGLSPRVRGLVLLGELGCVACHKGGGGASGPLAPRPGPDLATVGPRVQANYLETFLANPQACEPGTAMPHVLRGRATIPADAASLSHYLRSFASGPTPTGDSPTRDPEAVARGRDTFHTIGCAACHTAPDGDQPTAPASAPSPNLPLDHVARKYRPHSLREFLLAPHLARPGGRMPDLHLSPREAFDISSYLLGDVNDPTPAAPPHPLDPERVAAGRVLFGELGCAQCHELRDADRTDAELPLPLADLNPSAGCLSATDGPWPHYTFHATQRGDLLAALDALDAPLDDEQRVQQHLASRHCFACHQRGELGAVTAARSPIFTSGDPALGQDSRIPPTLDGVGDKLQPGWMVNTIAHGQSVRPYIPTRMPGFGEPFAQQLAALLERVDALPAEPPPADLRPLPKDKELARAVTKQGRDLVGGKGMNCIACHLFAGEKAGGIGGLDIATTTGERLRPEWFVRFMRDPVRFKPNTLMPQFFPGGDTSRPELGDGNAAHQIEAMWHYLAEGRNVRRPDGMRPPAIELPVADEAVILRRSVQGAGKRGVSVGYPGGINIVFDAEHLALQQIWWGKFVDASPVWTGQGSGKARILGKPRFTLHGGPAFVSPNEADAPWPTSTRRELGHQFLGYDLDEQRRPSFRYVCHGVEITDTPREVLDEPSGVLLRRTLQFARQDGRDGSGPPLSFVVARARSITDLGDGRATINDALEITISPHPFRIRRRTRPVNEVGEEEPQDVMELSVDIPVQAIGNLAITYGRPKPAPEEGK